MSSNELKDFLRKLARDAEGGCSRSEIAPPLTQQLVKIKECLDAAQNILENPEISIHAPNALSKAKDAVLQARDKYNQHVYTCSPEEYYMICPVMKDATAALELAKKAEILATNRVREISDVDQHNAKTPIWPTIIALIGAFPCGYIFAIAYGMTSAALFGIHADTTQVGTAFMLILIGPILGYNIVKQLLLRARKRSYPKPY